MKRTTSGFTLIELLVVIAIIGILSGIVIASLNSARVKGADAAVKGQLAQMRSQAELHYDNNSQSYASFCTGSGATMLTQVSDNAAAAATCTASATSTAIAALLKGGSVWCVDVSGKNAASAQTTSAAASVLGVCL